jgi:hypothetical protein
VSDVQVHDVGRLAEMRQRVAESVETIGFICESSLQIADQLLQEIATEVASRRSAYERCDGEQEDCQPLYRRWQVALTAQRHFEQARGSTATQLGAHRRQLDQLKAESTRYLSGLQQHLAAVALGATALTGAAAGDGSAGSGGSAGGVPGQMSVEDRGRYGGAVQRYGDHGDDLNSRLWAANGGPLSEEDQDWVAGLEAAFEAAGRTDRQMTLNRDIGTMFLSTILDEKGLTTSASTEAIKTVLTDKGKLHRHFGFMSTSTEHPFGERPVHLTVDVPAGTKILDLRSMAEGGSGLSGYSESEYLLPRDLFFTIDPKSVRFDEGRWFMRLGIETEY